MLHGGPRSHPGRQLLHWLSWDLMPLPCAPGTCHPLKCAFPCWAASPSLLWVALTWPGLCMLEKEKAKKGLGVAGGKNQGQPSLTPTRLAGDPTDVCGPSCCGHHQESDCLGQI